MRELIGLAVGLAACVASAQQPVRQDIEHVIEVEEQRIAQQQARLDAVVARLKVVDGEMERRVERVCGYVARVTDSLDSKTKVTRAKQDLVEGLMKGIEFYSRERGRLFGELMRPYSLATKEAYAEDIRWLNERIEKRGDQALALIASLPAEKDLEKSSTHYGDGAKIVTANPAHVQQKRVAGVGGHMRKDACDALAASIAKLKNDNVALERAAKGARTEEGRAFARELLARNQALVEKRAEQIAAARLAASTSVKPLGSKAAEALADQIEDERADFKKDSAEWTRLKNERDLERARLLAMQDRLSSHRRALAEAAP